MPPFKRKFLKFKKPLLTVFLAAIALGFLYFSLKVYLPIYSFSKTNGLNFKTAVNLLTDKKGILLKKTDGRTNILLLGISGGKHEGAELTDSIIFLSIH